MATRKISYASSASITISLASLATSATLVAGQESDAIDNSTNLYIDALLGGKITVGTTPTINTQVEVWVIPKADDTNWPDVFDGTGSAETVTTREILAASGKLAVVFTLPATTSNVALWFSGISIASLFGGTMPKAWALFVVHNTGVALNATAGNHAITYTGITETVA